MAVNRDQHMFAQRLVIIGPLQLNALKWISSSSNWKKKPENSNNNFLTSMLTLVDTIEGPGGKCKLHFYKFEKIAFKGQLVKPKVLFVNVNCASSLMRWFLPKDLPAFPEFVRRNAHIYYKRWGLLDDNNCWINCILYGNCFKSKGIIRRTHRVVREIPIWAERRGSDVRGKL